MAAPDYCPLNDRPLPERLDALRNLDSAPRTPTRSGALTPQQRGYCLEALLADLMRAEGLEPRSSYKTEGEQIDGSFVLDGRTILLEAKWLGKEMPASGIYSFRGKVDGKLVGTIA